MQVRIWKSQDTYSPADWMPTNKPTEVSRIKLKNLNSTARPYDEWAVWEGPQIPKLSLLKYSFAIRLYIIAITYLFC